MFEKDLIQIGETEGDDEDDDPIVPPTVKWSPIFPVLNRRVLVYVAAKSV